MNNFDRWRLYTDGLISPDLYINFGFYYLIGAALQRRVWIGPPHLPLYPNLFIILVGEPGVGKGLVIKQIAEILKHHKMPDPNINKNIPKNLSPEDLAVIEAIREKDYSTALESEGLFEKSKEKNLRNVEKPLLFPVAADATTYEALVRALAKSLRRINYVDTEAVNGSPILRPYTHSSLCFCLEEISSLLRKRTEDVVHLLIQAYDCGDYIYDTKTQGKDRIKKCCLNFFGGTTPGFMQETFDDQLLTEGFASRTLFIFASQNRKVQLWIPDLTEEQKDAYREIVAHVEKLSHLYGRVIVDPKDMEYLEEWWRESQHSRPNTSMRLNSYYARKQIHVLKLATAIHFSNSLDMYIDRSSFDEAISMLAEAEKSMHYALGFDAANPLASASKKIQRYIEVNGKQTLKQLAVEFWEVLPNPNQDLDDIITHLQASGKVKMFQSENEEGTTYNYFDVIRRGKI